MGINVSYAQLIGTGSSTQKKQSDLDWYNCSFDKDGVYGCEVNKAYDFLKDRKIKKRPIVALIGTGIDVEHEDIKQAIWVNPKEKADGKDNDKNGRIDDINGWNFLGGKDGQVMESLMQEGDREFLRLKDKYADYMTSNGEFFKIVNEKLTKVPAPENLTEYTYYKNKEELFDEIVNPIYHYLNLAIEKEEKEEGSALERFKATGEEYVLKLLSQHKNLVILMDKAQGTKHENAKQVFIKILENHIKRQVQKKGIIIEEKILIHILASNFTESLLEIARHYENSEWAKKMLNLVTKCYYEGVNSI